MFFNEDFYGDNLNQIQLNTGDIFRVEIVKQTASREAYIEFQSTLV